MVTTNSGSATPNSPRAVNSGAIQTGQPRRQSIASRCIRPDSAATSTPASSTPGTAWRGQARRPAR